ncbi:MAG: phosphoribosyl-AMP cyclohydrolase [Desulfarculales bacterium]|jgi:phosphoribosyl-AMP cyclohydrolase|nr:phosphoribosyl-AMP cyclohydrolase [Desulfarculales bacterium]
MIQLDFAKSGGLIPAIAQDARTGKVLMQAYINEESWRLSLATGEVHYWSRSRQELWHKGGSSGNVQKIKSIYVDCDNDSVLFQIEQIGGAACHTGRESCFYRKVAGNELITEGEPLFDPKEVYKK